jgi:hypothetical protein
MRCVLSPRAACAPCLTALAQNYTFVMVRKYSERRVYSWTTDIEMTDDFHENGSPRRLSVLPQTSSLTLAIAPQKAASTMM